MKEKNIQSKIMIELSENNCTIFRNNCGVHKTEDGRFIRYGVASPGGSDLIGWTKVVITQDMVGNTVGVFTAIEVKTKTGRASPEQLRFIDAVHRAGGIAGICRSAEDAIALIEGRA